jgi:hypothetical protein
MTPATATIARLGRGPVYLERSSYYPTYGAYVRGVMGEAGKWDGDHNAVRIQLAVRVALVCLAEAMTVDTLNEPARLLRAV